jgi:UDP-hydrolysing UDP-N-acetyl-D-glucosamine 2-epimerase
MKKILVVTGTRSEYGLLYNVIKKIQESNNLELQLVVTGNHLVLEYGYTVETIKKDGFKIDEKIDMLVNSNKKSGVVKSMGIELIQMAQAFDRLKPDLILILGDRYEIFVAATCAMMMNVPIAHIAGGEITEGAVDDQIRHAITKMSHLHFVETETYRNNVVKMGEEKWRIYNVGSLGVENVIGNVYLSCSDLFNRMGVFVDKNTMLVTFHPVTLELDKLHSQVDNLVDALMKFKEKKIIITYPNSDAGNKYIIRKFKELASLKNNVFLFKSLGVQKYLSAMKLCGCVVGNSSSAIVESPVLKIPVVNIGNRQRGRIMADNIIQCSYSSDDIYNAVLYAFSREFINIAKDTKSLYGNGYASNNIINILESISINDTLIKKKLVIT